MHSYLSINECMASQGLFHRSNHKILVERVCPCFRGSCIKGIGKRHAVKFNSKRPGENSVCTLDLRGVCMLKNFIKAKLMIISKANRDMLRYNIEIYGIVTCISLKIFVIFSTVDVIGSEVHTDSRRPGTSPQRVWNQCQKAQLLYLNFPSHTNTHFYHHNVISMC